MSDFLDRIEKLSPRRLALLALEQHEQLEAAAQRAHEPIAIVGLACRFPGDADGPDGYWRLLAEGRDAIGEVPADRWDIDAWFDPDPDAPARMSTRSGGFLTRLNEFDAAFFGIAPREALTMDPQQRLLLELAWQALEDGGIAPDRLAGSATGVFVGLCNNDHFTRLLQRGAESIDAYLASGNAPSVAAGRIAYCLGLRGPALAIDTACSSSLVALHQAVRSLRSGETDVALAAGVNVMCSPETTVALSKAHMLAPDGRCKTFDAAADGFARGEGCGVLVLKRLSDAQAAGDSVRAVIRGSALNQDGRSGGLTVPNGPSQVAVIRSALADARLQPTDIDYVEAHGTGTSLGDPIEVRALAQALAMDRAADAPLKVGSVKTNFGHLESAAGIAGVIKVVLALQHERIPAHLHFREPSPHVDWDLAPIEITAHGAPWPRGTRVRRAGVSSFGFSGTNAHVILEEAPETRAEIPTHAISLEQSALAPRNVHCLPLSARTPAALADVAARLLAQLDNDDRADHDLASLAFSAATGRSHFTERAAIVAADVETVREALQALAQGTEHEALVRGTAHPGQTPEIAFLFTGQGSQYPGMGRQLYETSSVYRAVIDRCDALLGADAQGRTLCTVLFGATSAAADAAPIHETAWTQPALFATEMAAVALWRAWGIEPAAAIGHSLGEYAAACVAGVFTLEDGLVLVAERGRLMDTLPRGGAMAALFAAVDTVRSVLTAHAGDVDIAAINAPDSVVISGDAVTVDAVLADFAARDVQGKRLSISLAAHSALVEPALDAMQSCAGRVPMREPRIPVAWNVTGGAALPDGAPDARYWRRHLREPVRVGEGIETLHRQGYTTLLEVGPHPTLMALAQRSLPEAGTLALCSMRRAKDDWSEMLRSLAQLYVHGAPIDWAAFDEPYDRQRVRLPSYPFERRSFWITPAARDAQSPPQGADDAGDARDARDARTVSGNGALLGRRLGTAVPIFERLLTPTTLAYLNDHRVHGAALVAGPVFLEMAQAAAREVDGDALRGVRDFRISDPLVLPDAGRVVQVHLGEARDAARTFTVFSCAADGAGEWRRHADGQLTVLRAEAAAAGGSVTALTATQDALGAAESGDAFYQQLRGLGIELGAGFRSVVRAHRRAGEALVALQLPVTSAGDEVVWAHPALLDGALQSVGVALPHAREQDTAYLLTAIGRVDLAGPLPTELWCHARVLNARDVDPNEWLAEVTLRSLDGAVLGVIQDVRLHRATREALARAARNDSGSELFYSLEWQPAPLAPVAAASLLAPPEFVAPLVERFDALAAQHGLAVYETLLPELDRLSVEHVVVALLALGLDDTPGRRFTAAEEAARLGIVQEHGRLFGRLLGMLVQEGWLRTHDGVFEVAASLPVVRPEARYEALLAQFGGVAGELRTLQRCGPELERVLRGAQDPLQLLFPGGSFAEARALYVESPFAQTYNRTLAEALQAACARLPANARLRVLEIGAGTGGTTSYVLPHLPSGRCAYHFTDVSPIFLDRAQEQFAAFPFVSYGLLDIERDPLAQGVEAGGFDVVIAANVLHATADLQQTLRHVQRLMAPGALLLLLEGVAPERWVDLTFGLTEGWWRFTDTNVRADYPLIGREAWITCLHDVGFTHAVAVPPSTHLARGAGQQALLLARAAKGGRHWAIAGVGSSIGTAPGSALGAALVERLTSRGDSASLLPVDPTGVALPAGADLVYLGGVDLHALERDADEAERVAGRLAGAYPLEWLQKARSFGARTWFVTMSSQGTALGNAHRAPGAAWQAPLWGLGRGAALEDPEHWGGLIDLPLDTAEANAERLARALGDADHEDQCLWDGDGRRVLRLCHAPPPSDAVFAARPDGTYLVTGGFGGLGLVVARWLVTCGARHIALLGRHPDMTSDGVRELQAAGATVIALQADVADSRSMHDAFATLRRDAPPLRGVLHAAAHLHAEPLATLTVDQFAAMLRPKLAGGALIERLTRDMGLDFLVLFSSTTALLGAKGLAHYAAGNAFLDTLAQVTHSASRRVLSINWGTWDVMRLAGADEQRRYREGGLLPMSTRDALGALGRLLAAPADMRSPQAIVADIDWSVLRPLLESRRGRPLLSQLGTARAATVEARSSVAAGPSLAERLAATPEALRRDVLVEFVQREVSEVLSLGRDAAVPIATGLFDLGMDSLMSVELKRRLERGAGRALPSTLTFNYPSIEALARFLELQLGADSANRVVGSATPGSAGATPTIPTAATTRSHGDAPAVTSDGELDALSDEELEARLLARLEQSQ